jgi:hypothetical protein
LGLKQNNQKFSRVTKITNLNDSLKQAARAPSHEGRYLSRVDSNPEGGRDPNTLQDPVLKKVYALL